METILLARSHSTEQRDISKRRDALDNISYFGKYLHCCEMKAFRRVN